MIPTETEFLDLCKDIRRGDTYGGIEESIVENYFSKSGVYQKKLLNVRWQDRSSMLYKFTKEVDVYSNFIWMNHEIGGVSGGSCWETSDPQEYTNKEPMPEFESFYNILEKVCPNITFLQARKLENDIVNDCDHTNREYYGNSTDYIIKYINLKDLYKYLIVNDLLK